MPTPEGLKWVPLIFARVTDDWSLGKIANWLNAEGVRPPGGGRWWPRTLNQLIRCPTYMGLRCAQDPRVRKYGKVLHECEALVPADVWKAANDALATRDKHGSRPPKRLPGAMLTSVIFCPCGGAMYRSGQFYRCHGIPKLGPGRALHGFHVVVPLAAQELEAAA